MRPGVGRRTINDVRSTDGSHDHPFETGPAGRIESDEATVRAAMGQLYGAAAALVAGDQEGAALLIGDLRSAFSSVTELLVTISFATLERLEHAFADRSLRPPDGAPPSARTILTEAERYGVAPARAVHTAAWRLEAVRCNDRRRVVTEATEWSSAGAEGQLVSGAVALLAAALAHAATAVGDDPLRVARRLCLAASVT